MRCLRFHAAALLTAALCSCASLRTYDMAKVNAELSQTVQNTLAIVQKTQSDYREKNSLLEGLRKLGRPEYRAVEKDLNEKMSAMKSSSERMDGQRKAMREAAGQAAALGYAHAQITSDSPDYEKVRDALSKFETAARDVNSTVVEYSRQSNSLADLVAHNKLYYDFDVKEFQMRVQQAIKAAQSNRAFIKNELKKSESLLNNWNQPESRSSAQSVFKEMTATAQNFTSKAQHLPAISHAMHAATHGNAKVSSLDPNWPGVQKLIDDFDQSVQDLRASYEKFQEELGRFRPPTKPSQ